MLPMAEQCCFEMIYYAIFLQKATLADCAVMRYISYKLAYSTTAVVELHSSVNMLSENGHANASIHIRQNKAIM